MNGETSLTTFAQNLIDGNAQHSELDSVQIELKNFLNINIKDVVYSTLSLLDRRKHGIFFSGPKWAKTLCSNINIGDWKRFIDPSVGTGDLLLEICINLPLEKTFFETVTSWAKRLVAIDLRSSFLQFTWIRIHLLALHRHSEIDPNVHGYLLPLPDTFIIGDSLKIKIDIRSGDCVIMNPPYQRIIAEKNSFVGKGKRSAAAFHVENILLQSPPGIGVVALLPDVLRSGSSYKNFRNEISQRLNIRSFDPFGSFGLDADIDVAVLVGTTQEKESLKEARILEGITTLGDKFHVRVGPVVPHRTVTLGPRHAYLTAKNAVVGDNINELTETAEFATRLEKGPFVIVRRTSSPSDKKRARATLVSANIDFYIENHLLVILPFKQSIEECEELIRVLNDPRTNDWLNNKIRCRHLTVGALKALPWLENL